MDLDQHRAANLANWDERVAIHLTGYDLDRLRSDPDAISGVVAYDVPRLGDVAGLRGVHLQCHIGTDTVSLARLGAHMTGLDFSPRALTAARGLAADLGVDVEFVRAELHDAVDVLGSERFDLVYTGVGAINWLPDIRAWARIVADLLVPGGRVHVREGHPMMNTLDDRRDDRELVVTYPYFETDEPLEFDEPETYAGTGGTVANSVTYSWNHGIGEIVTAVLDAGLEVTLLEEHREVEWAFFEWMPRTADGQRWRLPYELADRVPLMFTLQARKPG